MACAPGSLPPGEVLSAMAASGGAALCHHGRSGYQPFVSFNLNAFDAARMPPGHFSHASYAQQTSYHGHGPCATLQLPLVYLLFINHERLKKKH
jgi:hypothetical protein